MPEANAYSGKWFDSFAKGIDLAQTGREVDWIQSVAPPATFPRVLDLCCGLGRHAGMLASRGYDVVGVDRDLAVIEQAKTAHQHVQLVTGDMRRIV